MKSARTTTQLKAALAYRKQVFIIWSDSDMSNRYGPRIVTDGLVLCLDAADRNSYPLSGDIWYDLSGNGNNGTISGATYSDSNKCFNYDGTDATVTTAISSPTVRTVFIVFRRNGTQTGSASLLIGKRSGGCYSSALYLNYTTALRAYSAGPEVAVTSVADNTWYHIAVVAKVSGGTDFYVNGNYSSGFSTNFNCNGMLENIGSSCNASGSLKGDITLVTAYSIEFSADQIKQNYNATKGRFGL